MSKAWQASVFMAVLLLGFIGGYARGHFDGREAERTRFVEVLQLKIMELDGKNRALQADIDEIVAECEEIKAAIARRIAQRMLLEASK